MRYLRMSADFAASRPLGLPRDNGLGMEPDQLYDVGLDVRARAAAHDALRRLPVGLIAKGDADRFVRTPGIATGLIVAAVHPGFLAASCASASRCLTCCTEY